MEENKNKQASEADLLTDAEIDSLEQDASDSDVVADMIDEDEIITFGVNDDKKKKSKFLEDKVDASTPELTADNYDIHIPTPQPEDADARIAGKTPLRIVYDMNGAEVTDGLKRFHQLTLYTKNIVYTIILFVIFCLYVYRITTAQAADSMQYFLAVTCVALVAFLWYMPFRHIKATREAVEKAHNTFTVDFYDTCIMVGDEGQQQMVDYELQKPRVIAFETPLNFCVGVGKEKVFIVPKRCTGEFTDAVRACLQTGFKDKFKSFTA